MTAYKFTPKKNNITAKKQNVKQTTKKTSQSRKLNILNILNKSSSKKLALIAIAVILIILIKPVITGNILLSNEDRELAKSSDFPDLSKFEANKELYLCTQELFHSQNNLHDYKTQTSQDANMLNSCLKEKSALTADYSACTASLSPCQSGLEICNNLKTSLSQEIKICNDELIIKKQDFSELELENYEIKTNYAESYCCIYKIIVGNDNLNYYRFTKNKVICTDDPDDEEFVC